MVRSAHILQLAVVALLCVGVLMVHSAGMRLGQGSDGLLGYLQTRHTIYAALAIVAMLIASRVNVRELFRTRGLWNPLWLMVGASLVLMVLTLVPGVGQVAGGASRWLQLGPESWGLRFQPSELVKWVLLMAVAWWCARWRGAMHRLDVGLAPPLVLIAVACGLVVVEDFGTAALIGGVAVSLLFAGGARWWQLGMMVPPAAVVAVAAIWQSPYRLTRVISFLDPWADPEGAGYHPIQSMVAIAQGGWLGQGLGNGIQKFGYLPEATTDFIFAVICEELGLLGAGLVVGLYMVVLWTGLGIVKNTRETFGRLVGLGVLLMVGFQAVMNIAVVTVVVPTKGIALPLISAGGTGWILTAFALGLVAALDNARYYEMLDEQAGAGADADASEDEDDDDADHGGGYAEVDIDLQRQRLREMALRN